MLPIPAYRRNSLKDKLNFFLDYLKKKSHFTFIIIFFKKWELATAKIEALQKTSMPEPLLPIATAPMKLMASEED